MTSYSPYIARILLGRWLRRHRQRKGLSLAEAARKTGISESKLSKLERAVNEAIKLPDIFACSHIYELAGNETTHLVELAEGADSPGWYHPYDVPPELAYYIELEGAASALHIYEQEFIDGLFQIELYLEALRASRPGTKGGPDNGLRIERQEAIFGKEAPPEIVYLTNEAALRREVGGPDVMRKQVRHLLEMDERDHIAIYVVPFAAGAHPSMAGSYRIMQFADDVFPTTVYLESLHGSHYEDGEPIAGQYGEVFEKTRQPSLAVPIKEFINAHNELA
jgi:transcriptional regulator with XRE-family HTH domain